MFSIMRVSAEELARTHNRGDSPLRDFLRLLLSVQHDVLDVGPLPHHATVIGVLLRLAVFASGEAQCLRTSGEVRLSPLSCGPGRCHWRRRHVYSVCTGAAESSRW